MKCVWNSAFSFILIHLFVFIFPHSTQQVNKGPYIYEIHKEGCEGVLEICHMFADYIVFKQ